MDFRNPRPRGERRSTVSRKNLYKQNGVASKWTLKWPPLLDTRRKWRQKYHNCLQLLTIFNGLLIWTSEVRPTFLRRWKDLAALRSGRDVFYASGLSSEQWIPSIYTSRRNALRPWLLGCSRLIGRQAVFWGIWVLSGRAELLRGMSGYFCNWRYSG